MTPLGELYIVATPIGNLEDVTVRALSILRTVDLLFSEDTRTSRKLLNHWQIKKPLLAWHEHSSPARLSRVITELKRGQKIAYLTEAGTPGLSDPGQRLVQAALANGIRVIPLPGPSALATLISVAGWPIKEFLFLGFLPKKGRHKIWEELKKNRYPIVLYESPFRLLKTLDEIKEQLDDPVLVLGREMTKLFEEFVRGRVEEIKEHFKSTPLKGEVTLLIYRGSQK